MSPEQSTAAPPSKTSTLAPFLSLAPGGNEQYVQDAIRRLANTCSIRQHEIKKALHSKPQRGRKRADLNDAERHELTRNRNREHAKTTRIRKKARYQELLECERKLQELLEKDELDEKRRQCVLGFVAVRERMLQVIAHSCYSSEDDQKTVQQLEALVEEISTLSYQDGTSHDDLSAVDRMKRFDRTLASRAVHTFGAHLLLSYKMDRSIDDIAISPRGFSVAEIEVVGPGNRLLLTALLKIEFAPNSAKIRTIAFTTLREPCERGGFDRLDDQVSHPSAVSFDLDKDRPEIGDGCEPKAENNDELNLE